MVYLIICISSEGTYTGEAECLCEIKYNAKWSIRHVNALFLPYTKHISRCSNLKEPLLIVLLNFLSHHQMVNYKNLSWDFKFLKTHVDIDFNNDI